MFGAPKSTLQTVCMKDNNPIPFMVKGPCRSEDRVLKDGVLTWKVACNDKDGVSISGKGELRAEEPGFRGVTDIDVVVGEKKIATKSNWIGKRVGDCDPEKEKPASK